MSADKTSEAVSCMSKVLKIQPSNVKALNKRAELNYTLGHFTKASTDLQSVLKIDSSNKEALSLSNTVKEKTSKEASEYKDQGNEAIKIKDYVKAIDCYSKAIEADVSDNNIPSYSNRAMAYLKLGKNSKAEMDATYVIDKSREDSERLPLLKKALFRRGVARRDQESLSHLENAISDFTELCSLDVEQAVCTRACKDQTELTEEYCRQTSICSSISSGCESRCRISDFYATYGSCRRYWIDREGD
jgi:tetratricopeptide (TPR) repeat protein